VLCKTAVAATCPRHHATMQPIFVSMPAWDPPPPKAHLYHTPALFAAAVAGFSFRNAANPVGV
jgi:hypothetical protein